MSSIKHRAEKDCLNCGHEVEDKYCSYCGQENIVVKEKALSMVTHAIADYFHFEHKFFATMRPLMLKPGQLTKEYTEGKRARFIHPIRLYIFISIVFFLIVLSNAFVENNVVKNNSNNVNFRVPNDTATKAELVKALKFVPNNSHAEKAIKSRIKDIETGKVKKDTSGNNYYSGSDPNWILKSDSTYEAYLNRVNKFPLADRPGFIRKYIAKNQIKFRGEDGQKKFMESFTHNIPKMMFILLPLFAMMLHLFYIRKKKYFYEDLIYAFHLHSNFFLSVLVLKFLIWLSAFAIDIDGILVTVYVFYFIWYIYRSLRVFYNSSRWMTVFKMFFLFIGYNILLAISFMLLAAFTVMAQ